MLFLLFLFHIKYGILTLLLLFQSLLAAECYGSKLEKIYHVLLSCFLTYHFFLLGSKYMDLLYFVNGKRSHLTLIMLKSMLGWRWCCKLLKSNIFYLSRIKKVYIFSLRDIQTKVRFPVYPIIWILSRNLISETHIKYRILDIGDNKSWPVYV